MTEDVGERRGGTKTRGNRERVACSQLRVEREREAARGQGARAQRPGELKLQRGGASREDEEDEQ